MSKPTQTCYLTTDTCRGPHFCIKTGCKCLPCDYDNDSKFNPAPIILSLMFGIFFLFTIAMIIMRKARARRMKIAREKASQNAKVPSNHYGNIQVESLPQESFMQIYNPQANYSNMNMTTLQGDMSMNAGNPNGVFPMVNQPVQYGQGFNGFNQMDPNYGIYQQQQAFPNYNVYPNPSGFNPNPTQY